MHRTGDLKDNESSITEIRYIKLKLKFKNIGNSIKNSSPSETRTRAFRVKAEYPSHLDQWGSFIYLYAILPHICFE